MILSAGKSDQPAGVQVERGPGFAHWTSGFFLSGETEIICQGRPYHFRARQGILIPPNTPYRLQVRRREREVWMLFDPRPDWVPALRHPECPSGVSLISFHEPAHWLRMKRALEDLLHWWGQTPPELPLAENALEQVLLLALHARDSESRERLDERLKRLTQHVEEHLGEPLSVDQLARVAALSPSRLAHVFRERMGLPLMQYVETRRMERAKHLLLQTDLPVKEIGARTGFPNAEHFSVRFSKCVGQSPRAYRMAPPKRFAELNPDSAS